MQPLESTSLSTSKPAAKPASKRAILQNSAHRLKFITGETDTILPAPAPSPPKQPPPDITTAFPTFGAGPFPAPSSSPSQRSFKVKLTYVVCLVVAFLMAANSLLCFPEGYQDRKQLTYSYLIVLLITCGLAHKEIMTLMWQLALTLFVWVGLVFGANSVTQGWGPAPDPSNLGWITTAAFFLEFFVVVVKSNGLLKKLIGFASPPTVWMAHNLLRMALTTFLAIIYPTIGNHLEFHGLPRWAEGAGGAVVWGWLSMLVWSRVATKLLP